MEFVRYTDATDFYLATEALLVQYEAENNLIIGVVNRLRNEHVMRITADVLLGAVCEYGCPIAAVMMTPPHNLALTRMSREVAVFLADQLTALQIHVPGAMGPSDTAALFSSAWSAVHGTRTELSMAMRIYQLNSVTWPHLPTGYFTEAIPDDLDCVDGWANPYQNREGLQSLIAEHHLFLWRDPEPVSMASATRHTPNGFCVTAVYTPPEYRCKGYATANVAAVSQRMLDSGKKYCFLYTDLANPTSNSIYQKIGYRPVCDADAYNFVKEE